MVDKNFSNDSEYNKHPRPQHRRQKWESLNGLWDFSIDVNAALEIPEQVKWEQKILVPFSPETSGSGIGNTGFYSAVWYRRTFEAPQLDESESLLLHFEAVDYHATVWVNGARIFRHEGGYTPFTVDITHALRPGAAQEIIVRAEDDPADLSKPRGKQDWKLEPHSIWYPRTTGIWQTVWLEVVPKTCLDSLQWSSNLERWEICLAAAVRSISSEKLTLSVRLTRGEQTLASDSYEVISGEVHRRIALSDPGIDDFRNTLLWSPSSPTLIDATIELRDQSGTVVDSVQSYTALRSVSVQGDRFILNGRPMILRMVLDQGYWPDTGLTAPNDDALVQDILLAKKMGFNGVRKHQKIESARFLYWADTLGLLVWEEMPSAYRYTTKSIERVTSQWLEVLHRDFSHPCIVAWVPFNESWGVPDLPDSPAQRHYVQALYHLTKSLDSTRPVIGNDGWESVATDIIGIHDYDSDPERIGKRYGLDVIEAQLFKHERPGGRMLLMGADKGWKHPIMLTEFGGIAFASSGDDSWGYSRTETAEQLVQRYGELLRTVRNLPALAGFCYTQFADTYQEANGLLYADRTPKAPIEEIALATTGAVPDQGPQAEASWREQILQQR
jgi:beta-galactosidase/beta-glucuronidase